MHILWSADPFIVSVDYIKGTDLNLELTTSVFKSIEWKVNISRSERFYSTKSIKIDLPKNSDNWAYVKLTATTFDGRKITKDKFIPNYEFSRKSDYVGVAKSGTPFYIPFSGTVLGYPADMNYHGGNYFSWADGGSGPVGRSIGVKSNGTSYEKWFYFYTY